MFGIIISAITPLLIIGQIYTTIKIFKTKSVSKNMFKIDVSELAIMVSATLFYPHVFELGLLGC